MKSNLKQKNREPKAVIYDNCMGLTYVVTFIGGQWWVTSPNEKLQPLEKFFDRDDIDLCYLCEAGGTVGALALAKMLGVALENPEIEVDKVLRQRVECLKRLGVTLDVKDEPLMLEMETIPNGDNRFRHGKYSVTCHLNGNYFEKIFDVDAFESKDDAENWGNYYFDALESVGVELHIIRKVQKQGC